MCYRDNVEPLDFRGIHVACLTGDNGHGKSALLDAMTWALWGKARARSDNDLIYVGADEMQVEFEFALGSSIYRVIRKRSRRARGSSSLELNVLSHGVYHPITEPTLRATQERINELLRMDYETFINSAFLMQGRADEFTVKRPGERKRILGEILGLELYDRFEEAAKERARAKAQEAAEIAAQIREIDRELEHLPEYEVQVTQARQEVMALSGQLLELERELQALRLERQDLLNQRARMDDLNRRLARQEQEMAEAEEQLAEARARLANFEQILAQQVEIEAGYTELQAVREAVEKWNSRLQEHSRLSERRRKLEQTVLQARGKLEAQLRSLQDRMAILRERAQQAAHWESQLAEAQAALARLTEREAEREAVRAQITSLKEEDVTLKAQNEQLRAEMEAIQGKVDMLDVEQRQAACPLCGRPLSEEHRLRLLADFQAEGTVKGNHFRANVARRRAIKAELRELARQEAVLSDMLQTLAGWQRQAAQAEQALTETQTAARTVAQLQEQERSLRQQLETEDYAVEAQAEAKEIEASLAALGYDSAAHNADRQRAQELAFWQERYQALELARSQAQTVQAEVERLQALQARWGQEMEKDRAERNRLAQTVARLPGLEVLLMDVERQVEELVQKEQEARLRLGAARQRVETCHQLAKQREAKVQEQHQLAEEQALYEELRVAFGKRGLQAMIIEAAIPEIEEEANRLLSRMTDGRMSLRLETQRETKKGDTIETLDIIIADELGPRDYQTYSGGEAFRVNFALRVAISKLLARRAGARLQTLIIDEGFGTQDANGRERLVEAINAIQSDFERILVITHIEELKDLFPVRIDVVKTSQGSQLFLV